MNVSWATRFNGMGICCRISLLETSRLFLCPPREAAGETGPESGRPARQH